MNQINVSVEWQRLCDDYEKAQANHFRALSTVTQKFAAIGRGTSQTNPTNDELSDFESTWIEWEAVKKKMDAFIKQNV